LKELKRKIEEIKQSGSLSVVPVTSFSFNDHPFRKPSLVIFFCGCVHGCRGCHSKVLWDPDSEFCEKVQVKDLKGKVLKQYAKAEGAVKSLVLLGGDPVEYYPLIAEFLEELKEEVKDLEVVLFTGYSFEEVPERLLSVVDVVVDGRYEEDLKTEGFPASLNQRVWKKEKEGIWKDVTSIVRR